jgi:hypothetical protein
MQKIHDKFVAYHIKYYYGWTIIITNSSPSSPFLLCNREKEVPPFKKPRESFLYLVVRDLSPKGDHRNEELL